MFVGLEQSQRQSEVEQQRLFSHLSAHVATVHQSDVAADPAANQWSHLLSEGHLSGLHDTAGLRSSLKSRLSDVHSTGTKAGRLALLLLRLLPDLCTFLIPLLMHEHMQIFKNTYFII